jgi:ABC-type dipeptide/oligopeptide/nickel transport system permease component
MLTFVLRRLMVLPVLLFALSVLIVGLLQFLSAEQRASAFITTEAQARNLEKVIRDRGLDQPFHIQYWRWLKDTLSGDLGYSKASNKNVVDTIAERFPATLELALVAFLPVLGFALWLGTTAALHKDGFIDQFTRIYLVVTNNVPTFVIGIILLVVFYGGLNILPGIGRNDIILETTNPVNRVTGMIIVDSLISGNWVILIDALRHMVLPVVTLSVVLSSTIIKVMRGNMIEVMNLDYVRTARAKGLPERTVNLKHARRNALLPIVTLGGNLLVGLLGGAVITETIFAYPGIGQWGADAATQFDLPGILGFALLSALTVVMGQLVIDILYGVVDPRVRFD